MAIIEGKKIRDKKLKQLRKNLEKVERKLGLAIVQVGNDPASKVYIRQKEKLANELGYNFVHKKFRADVSEERIIKEIELLNNDENIDGILVQMPLPKHMHSNRIQNTINPLKDVDGLTHINAGKLLENIECLIPCTPKGIIDLLDEYKIPLEGSKVSVIGRSILVGKPIANLLTNRNATVTLCHSRTKEISKITKKSDIVIVAIGKKHYLSGDMVKKNAIVIDVGINSIDGKLYGDANFEELQDKCKYITPVPGGVGPMTVYELMNNVYLAYKLKNNK